MSLTSQNLALVFITLNITACGQDAGPRAAQRPTASAGDSAAGAPRVDTALAQPADPAIVTAGADTDSAAAAPSADSGATPIGVAQTGTDATASACTPRKTHPPACTGLSLAQGVSVGGFLSDTFTWSDATGRARSAAMVRNDRQDPAGRYGGYMRQYTYDVGGKPRVCAGSSNNHPGWGYTVNHFAGGGQSFSSRFVAGTYKVVFAGANHAIYEYRWTLTLDGKPVDATVQWMFTTGRDHPLWSVTFDATRAGKDAVKADTRAPYGDLQWDGGAGSDVEGEAWGDHYKFTTLSAPVTMSSGWSYDKPNTVPYVMQWSNSADAEMGAVQTQTYVQHDAGGYWNYAQWGKSSAAGPMPDDWNWTYQLNQYELPSTLKSKRLAWGTNYGAVGQSSYPTYGDAGSASGWPYQSYSVFMVLGRHATSPVTNVVGEVEAMQLATLTAKTGAIVASGPAGVGRPDTVKYAPAGYNHVYATWELTADANRVEATLDATRRALHAPTFVIHNYTAAKAPTLVSLNGECLSAGSEYFVSLDAAKHDLWITLADTITAKATLRVEM